MDLAVFEGFRQECGKGVLFFATMGDGDYVQEMMEASVKILNAQSTFETYGVEAFL